MANTFINRNGPRSTFYSPVFDYKIKTNDDYWKERKQKTATQGDNFFKQSERYR
jgi:hypothetical protein